MTARDEGREAGSVDAGSIEGLLRFSHAAMGSMLEVRCVHADAEYARQASRRAFGVVDRLEQDLSRFVENSDIARVNLLAAGESVRVSEPTMECLRLAKVMFEVTGGAFDVAKGSGLEAVELLAAEFGVRAQADGIRIDLGGIGKGYAVDRVVDELADWEVGRALVHSGYSSVRATEPPEGYEGWPLTLTDPITGALVARLSARDRAIGASGIRKTGHIVDPGTGRPVRSRPACWVSAPASALSAFCERAGVGPSPAAVADALSTAFMILPRDRIAAFCREHPGIDYWIVGPS